MQENEGEEEKQRETGNNNKILITEGWQRRQCGKTIPQKMETIEKIRTSVAEAGHSETEIPHEFWVKLMKQEYIWMKQVRPLKLLWKDRSKVEADHKELMRTNGKDGGKRSGDRSSLSKIRLKGAKRLSAKYRGSALRPMFPPLKAWLERQRSAGNYVDREDLFLEYRSLANKAIADAEDEASKGIYTGEKIKLKLAIGKREEGMKRSFLKNKDKLMYMLMREIGSKLLKPQRLIHLTTEEEKQRAHLSWRMYDYSLYLVCIVCRAR